MSKEEGQEEEMTDKVDETLRRCPGCGGMNVEETTRGIISGRDSNRVHCHDCGIFGCSQDWKDIADLQAALAEKRKEFDRMDSELAFLRTQRVSHRKVKDVLFKELDEKDKELVEMREYIDGSGTI